MYQLLRTALDVSSVRKDVISNNLVNVNTKDFKRSLIAPSLVLALIIWDVALSIFSKLKPISSLTFIPILKRKLEVIKVQEEIYKIL